MSLGIRPATDNSPGVWYDVAAFLRALTQLALAAIAGPRTQWPQDYKVAEACHVHIASVVLLPLVAVAGMAVYWPLSYGSDN